jgi:hypothetical protein
MQGIRSISGFWWSVPCRHALIDNASRWPYAHSTHECTFVHLALLLLGSTCQWHYFFLCYISVLGSPSNSYMISGSARLLMRLSLIYFITVVKHSLECSVVPYIWPYIDRVQISFRRLARNAWIPVPGNGIIQFSFMRWTNVLYLTVIFLMSHLLYGSNIT